MDHLGLVAADDRFCQSSVAAVPDAADRSFETGRGEPLGASDRNLLNSIEGRTTIEPIPERDAARRPWRDRSGGSGRHAAPRTSVVQRLLEGVEDGAGPVFERGGRGGNTPSDDAAGEGVDDESRIAEATMLAGQRPQPLAQSGLFPRPNRLAIRQRPRDARQAAGPQDRPRGSRQPVLRLSQGHRCASGGRRYQFFPEAPSAPRCQAAPRPAVPSAGGSPPPAPSAAQVRNGQPALLGPPLVERRLRDVAAPATLVELRPGLVRPGDPDDLRFAEPALAPLSCLRTKVEQTHLVHGPPTGGRVTTRPATSSPGGLAPPRCGPSTRRQRRRISSARLAVAVLPQPMPASSTPACSASPRHGARRSGRAARRRPLPLQPAFAPYRPARRLRRPAWRRPGRCWQGRRKAASRHRPVCPCAQRHRRARSPNAPLANTAENACFAGPLQLRSPVRRSPRGEQSAWGSRSTARCSSPVP